MKNKTKVAAMSTLLTSVLLNTYASASAVNLSSLSPTPVQNEFKRQAARTTQLSPLGLGLERLAREVKAPIISKQKTLAEMMGYPIYPVNRISSPVIENRRPGALSGSEIGLIAKESTAFIQLPNGASATGFFAAKCVLVTNAHVVEDSSHGLVTVLGSNKVYEFTRVLAVDEVNDVAIVAVPAALEVIPLKLSSEKAVVGDDVYVLGNPKGMKGAFTKGQVSAYRNINDFAQTVVDCYADGDLMELSATIYPGNSGSSVLNSRGEVIAIVSAYNKRCPSLAAARPVRFIKQLLKSCIS